MKKLIIIGMSLVLGIAGVELVNRYVIIDESSFVKSAEPILYNRIGGITSISSLVDNYIVLLLSDERVRHEFAQQLEDRNQLRQIRNLWIEQLCALSDGPCNSSLIKEEGWKWGLSLDQKTEQAFREILEVSISEMGINYKEKNELLTSLGGLKRQIVSQ